MPENLAKHELTRAEFSSMHNLCRKKHPLIVALRFSEKVGLLALKGNRYVHFWICVQSCKCVSVCGKAVALR